MTLNEASVRNAFRLYKIFFGRLVPQNSNDSYAYYTILNTF